MASRVCKLWIRPLIDILGEQRVGDRSSDRPMLLRYLLASASGGTAHADGDKVSSSTPNVSSRVSGPIAEHERAAVLVDALRQPSDISRGNVDIIDGLFPTG